METLEYYKLKDELGALIKDEIGKSLDNERDLQQRYIGIGLKIAAGGVAAAILALSVFGIKSFYEVDSAIKKIPAFITKRVDVEVTTRFNDTNPVAQYETMLLDSAARSIATSITTQSRNSFFALENRISDVIIRALSDQNIRLATKLSLIDAISTDRIRNVSPSLDQAVIAVVHQVSNDNPVNELSLIRCLNYFSHRSPDRFAGDVEKVYDSHVGISSVRLAVGRYAFALRRDGEDLVRKLGNSTDPNLKYLMHVRDLKIGTTKQLDHELFESTLARAFNTSGDGIVLSDVIDHIGSFKGLENSTDIVGQSLESIRGYAVSKNFSLAVEDATPGNAHFRFYAADGDGASASIDSIRFGTLMNLAAGRIREGLKRSNGKFTDPIKQAMDFWFPRLDSDIEAKPRRAGGFRLNDVQNARFVRMDGTEIPGASLSSNAIVTTQGMGTETKIILKWRSETGETKTIPVTAIVDLDPQSLQTYGIWDRASNED
jgi:hypothetical protein